MDKKEIVAYLDQKLSALYYTKRGQLYLKRCGPLIVTLYPDCEWSMIDFNIGIFTIWNKIDSVVNLREGSEYFNRILNSSYNEELKVHPAYPFVKNCGVAAEELYRVYTKCNLHDPKMNWNIYFSLLDKCLIPFMELMLTGNGRLQWENYEYKVALKWNATIPKHTYDETLFAVYHHDLPRLEDILFGYEEFKAENTSTEQNDLTYVEKQISNLKKFILWVQEEKWEEIQAFFDEQCKMMLTLLQKYSVPDLGEKS